MDNRHASHVWLYAFVDVLLVCVFVYSSFAWLVLPQINPIAKDNPDTLPPPGNIAVLACWPAGAIDVDVWLGSPNDKPVGYSRKSGLIWSLLRDDLGTASDASPVNCESAFARITPAGEYVINIHGYSILEPVSVHIEVALNGSLLAKTDLDIRLKQERTVVRFTLDGQGQLVPGSQSQVFKALRSAS